MRRREHEYGKPTEHEKTYNGYTNWDTWNLLLLLENTQKSDKWLQAWCDNFKRKIKGGRFDIAKAESIVGKYLIPAARGAKRFKWAVGEDFVADSDIDPKKVNKAEVVRDILQHDE